MAFEPDFDSDFCSKLQELFRWRRDVRRFRREALAEDLIGALVEAACLAPSVGLSEPWRFVRVKEEARREAVRLNFGRANAQALEGYEGEKAKLYASLKLEGLSDAPEQLAIFCDNGTVQGSGLGRQSMPETLEYSVVAAVQNLWLAARAMGIGVGWVSILEPAELIQILDVPKDWKLVAYLCVGIPETNSEEPELMRLGWESRGKIPCEILPR